MTMLFWLAAATLLSEDAASVAAGWLVRQGAIGDVIGAGEKRERLVDRLRHGTRRIFGHVPPWTESLENVVGAVVIDQGP